MSNEIEQTDEVMTDNAERLASEVVGRKIVKAERYGMGYYGNEDALLLTLDDGKRVALEGGSDCCAYTALDSFLLHPERVDHVITGVSTRGDYSEWHIYADMGDVLELSVGWSEGSGYYGYGFDIKVKE